MNHLPALTTFDGRRIAHIGTGHLDPMIGPTADVTTIEGYVLRDQPLDMLDRVNRRRALDAAIRRHPAGRALGGVA